MGADIEIYSKGEVHYFRDSYNPSNLAWVSDLSYWKVSQKDRMKMLREMSKTSLAKMNVQLKKIKKEYPDYSKKSLSDIKKHWIKQRNYLRTLLKNKDVEITMWSV